MDILQEFVEENILSKENILKYVDDYSIYSFYIGSELELRTKYSSPLRADDEDPSFSLFYSKYKPDTIWFKDSAKNIHGDVFDFIQVYLQVSLKNALLQINSDFGLGLSDENTKEFKPHLLKPAPVKKHAVKIQITAFEEETKEFVNYWTNLGITKKTRDRYYCKNPKVIHYITDIHLTNSSKELTISYEILGHYKIYKPFAERKFKFRNDYLDIYVEGAIQLEFKQDFCVITKSTKEIMFFWEHFKWECVAGKSETTPINPFFMDNVLKIQYKKVFIWLDNDTAGKESQAKYLKEYPWLIPITFDSFVEQSDPTDFYLSYETVEKRKIALQYLQQLITTKL